MTAVILAIGHSRPTIISRESWHRRSRPKYYRIWKQAKVQESGPRFRTQVHGVWVSNTLSVFRFRKFGPRCRKHCHRPKLKKRWLQLLPFRFGGSCTGRSWKTVWNSPKFGCYCILCWRSCLNKQSCRVRWRYLKQFSRYRPHAHA